MNSFNLIQEGKRILKESGIPSPELDSELILANLLSLPKEKIIIKNINEIPASKVLKFKEDIKRRAKFEPIAYIVNKREFWKYDFYVDRRALIPRPETELLVEKALKNLTKNSPNILEIGVGSGCILLTLLKEINNSRGVGIDISKSAIKVAVKNSRLLSVSNRVKFYNRSFLKFFSTKFDLIISNPPYIPSHELKNLQPDIKNYEPLLALDGGNDGLDVIRKVIYKSKQFLKTNGLLALEIGNGQYSKISKILYKNFFREVSSVKDFKNNVRCIFARLEKTKTQ